MISASPWNLPKKSPVEIHGSYSLHSILEIQKLLLILPLQRRQPQQLTVMVHFLASGFDHRQCSRVAGETSRLVANTLSFLKWQETSHRRPTQNLPNAFSPCPHIMFKFLIISMEIQLQEVAKGRSNWCNLGFNHSPLCGTCWTTSSCMTLPQVWYSF